MAAIVLEFRYYSENGLLIAENVEIQILQQEKKVNQISNFLACSNYNQ